MTNLGGSLPDVDRLVTTDVLVVGSGVAGLSAALAAAPRRVLLVTKGRLASGSSPWAQGGIAAAVDRSDSPRLHAEDTERAGRGLSEHDVVRLLTDEAPAAIRELVQRGVEFDRAPDGSLARGREGGHGMPRVLHAGGDRTGAAIVNALVRSVRDQNHVTVMEEVFVVDLIRSEGRVAGALAICGAERIGILAEDVVLATGGLGQIYRFTTNPEEVTGDGIAMAARAGARLVDMEFVQFHPTALGGDDDAHGARPLLTEALRGAGALLVDETGRRFLAEGELAPRDVVALGIFRHQNRGHGAFLDLRPILSLETRFPTVYASCRKAGLDPATEPIPVTPAAHYAMGGVAVDTTGRTSVPGLWACGETASSGAHGANRLASNSLLEAIVFGGRLARELGAHANPPSAPLVESVRPVLVPSRRADSALEIEAARSKLREVMWRHVGLERSAGGLVSTLTTLETLYREQEPKGVSSRAGGELRNMILVAALVTLAATRRRESRGAHYRSDYPESREELRQRIGMRLVSGRAALPERVLFETLDSPEALSPEPVLAGGGAR